ncbi:MAG: 2-polyprenyl-3-methyl-6-methoxy-1,4-benzoquinone monooxygenase [Proteobacteria bacterium]|nr:2-polyprenyl-3-methyl-6-methoxy-1,4-benzoquinone monooxygenase [Pseudomonadota bacterium]HQR05127.1 2-polyprenyl-3-methyl-6-methoxy-1,4-benzoquinone monooxygenase [Rhodocyclaceae bacterium]
MSDQLIIEFDRILRTLFAPAPTVRPMPGEDQRDSEMSDQEKRHAAALMRVNHCGEICAQALYQGQALTSRDSSTRTTMDTAAFEETEHLNWTERRIHELGGRKSLLNPLWYLGSLGIGVAAGILGDEWNLGFLAETEQQVGRHLEKHLSELPAQDHRSWAILEQMRIDETQHANTAIQAGARDLPEPVKRIMGLSSRVMTTLAYYV